MNIRRLFRFPLLLSLFVVLAGSLNAQVIAIKAGKLVDPDAGTAASNQIILVEGSTIKAVGSNVAIPAGARVVDLSSMTVLPGLTDSHTHMLLTFHPDIDGTYFITTVGYTTAYRAIEGVANARSMLESGFTSIRDVGNNGLYGDTDLRKAIDAGLVPGPTIVNACRIIAPYGGQFQLQPERPELAEPEYAVADTRDELRKAIRENIHYGARLIKIVVDDQRYIYSVDDIKYIVEEARAAGLKVAAHTVTEAGFHNAAEGGVASIEHGFRCTDADLELIKKKHIVLVGTDLTEQSARMWGAFDDVKAIRRVILDRTRRAYKIGVMMAYGSDMFFTDPKLSRGQLSLTFLDSYVEAGLPAPYILKMITVNGTRLLGLDNERGFIKPGFAADIIATPGNPLDDIMALKHVSFVMKNGVVFKSTAASR